MGFSRLRRCVESTACLRQGFLLTLVSNMTPTYTLEAQGQVKSPVLSRDSGTGPHDTLNMSQIVFERQRADRKDSRYELKHCYYPGRPFLVCEGIFVVVFTEISDSYCQQYLTYHGTSSSAKLANFKIETWQPARQLAWPKI